MGAITLGSPWLVQIRISHGHHRPRISVAAIMIRISHGRHRRPWAPSPPSDLRGLSKLCFVVRCLILWIQNLTFTCFARAGVTEQYHSLNMGDDIPLFADKNVMDI